MQEWVQITKEFPRIEELNSWKKEMDEKNIENIIVEYKGRYSLWRTVLPTDSKAIRQHLPRNGVIIEGDDKK